MKLRDLRVWVVSYDFLWSGIITILLWLALPNTISNNFAKDVYGAGIAVLSIVFSVFFAALVTIISTGDNDFITFLEEKRIFTRLLGMFRFSMLLLFIALLSSMFLYGFTVFIIDSHQTQQSKYFFMAFSFLFSYSLFGSFLSSQDAIRFAESRVKYAKIMSEKEADRKLFSK
jgi:formate hydrogenlyase subunit 3/multisubunit Na+/H+ antiporter MnhD subunit